jgi:hypothetical protein
MLTESILRPPSRAYFIKRYEWQLKSLREHDDRPLVINCGAEILSVITFHYDNPSANDLLAMYIKKSRKITEDIYDHGEWFPYSFSYLSKCLLQAYTRWSIEPALELLIKINFLSNDVPQDIVHFYGSNNTRWYKLNYNHIQKWIDKTYRTENTSILTPIKKRTPKPDKFTPIVNQICEFHRLVHKKTISYVYDAKRKAMVKRQLKDGRTVYDCAKAIIGNLYSEFHQGQHKDNDKNNGGKFYNGIDYIFPDAKKFENHLGYAEKAGIKDSFVKEQFDKFSAGEKCAFTPKTPDAQRTEDKRAKANTNSYVEFASSVFTFLSSATFDIDNVIELCRENDGLLKLLSDISDTAILTEIVLERMKVYGVLTQNHKDRIAEFCQKIIKEKK